MSAKEGDLESPNRLLTSSLALDSTDGFAAKYFIAMLSAEAVVSEQPLLALDGEKIKISHQT